MKKETWIRVNIWEGMKHTRFIKYIKGELLIPNKDTSIYPLANWSIIRHSHSLCFPSKNEIISIIDLHPSLFESDKESIDNTKKALKENGYIEEDCN